MAGTSSIPPNEIKVTANTWMLLRKLRESIEELKATMLTKQEFDAYFGPPSSESESSDDDDYDVMVKDAEDDDEHDEDDEDEDDDDDDNEISQL